MRNSNGRGKLGKTTICIGVYIPKKTHDDLIAAAKEQELTLSDIVRISIREYLTKVKAPETPETPAEESNTAEG